MRLFEKVRGVLRQDWQFPNLTLFDAMDATISRTRLWKTQTDEVKTRRRVGVPLINPEQTPSFLLNKLAKPGHSTNHASQTNNRSTQRPPGTDSSRLRRKRGNLRHPHLAPFRIPPQMRPIMPRLSKFQREFCPFLRHQQRLLSGLKSSNLHPPGLRLCADSLL